MKRIIGSDALQNKWKSDVRKFSRNVEISHYFNEYKVGGTAEANLIFSEKSFIPRSLMLNLTLSLFGENINLFEVGGRLEGFDNLLEDMFGPDGYFKEDSIQNFLNTFSSRQKRQANIEQFGVQNEEPKGMLYLRLFGKDLKFTSFKDLPRQIRKIFSNPMSLFTFTLEDKNMNFEKSSMFLDGSIIVPTVAGLPLNMTAKGVSSVQLKSKADINIKEFLTKGRASIGVEISPSVAVKISGSMSVDAFVTKTSIKSNSQIHSSTFIGASLGMGSFRKNTHFLTPSE